MSWPKNKGINRHGKQKRGTAVCSAGKEVSMEKKRNRQKRISKKISKKRNITGWHDSSYSYGGSCSQDKKWAYYRIYSES